MIAQTLEMDRVAAIDDAEQDGELQVIDEKVIRLLRTWRDRTLGFCDSSSLDTQALDDFLLRIVAPKSDYKGSLSGALAERLGANGRITPKHIKESVDELVEACREVVKRCAEQE